MINYGNKMFGIFENSEVESVFNDDHNEEEDTPESEFMLNTNEVNPEFEEMEVIEGNNNNGKSNEEYSQEPKKKNFEDKCDVCDKLFFDRSNFRRHLKTHTKTKSLRRGPYKNQSDYSKKQQSRISKLEISKLKEASNTEGLKEQIAKDFIKDYDEFIEKFLKKKNKNGLSVDDVVEIIQDTGITKNQLLKILSSISKKFPNLKLTEPRIKKALETRKQLFKDYFTTEFFCFQDKNNEDFERAVTWCNDVDEFLKYNAVLEEKNWEKQQNVVGIDYGKGSIKIVLTLHDEEKISDGDNKKFDTRRLVKESKVLCLVRDVPESHHNCKILFELININNLISKFSLDCKLINIIIGIQSNSAKYPCPFAECSKGSDGHWIKGKIRTILNIRKNNKSYQILF